ncbi:hypothetical protein [Mesorhizobium sp.]|uniref:hypothetical protein n=1 Tax=Mesorhizobium sp. TaxID=1871066 RepID=UPI000FE45FB9|nr:hypothetical protein [Mesorhizobium sp.]RWE34995.1 MAG: hypothetical protein EOS77_08460 [Mesorhizobium sp.]
MPQKSIDVLFEITTNEITSAIEQLRSAVPAPVAVPRGKTGFVFRYNEKTAEQALVLKSVRILSALYGAATLIDAGLLLEAGASMRMLDEAEADVMFLAGPIVFGHNPERNHERYMVEFFQEEFETDNPITSPQKRDRVSRKDVRAYVARTYGGTGGIGVSDVVAITETIEKTYSGYIHGAAAHIIDLYDGQRFVVPMRHDDRPLEAIRDQFSHYLSRALMTISIVAKAFGNDQLSKHLFDLERATFDEFGRPR